MPAHAGSWTVGAVGTLTSLSPRRSRVRDPHGLPTFVPRGRGELGGHAGLPNRSSGFDARRPLTMGARLTGQAAGSFLAPDVGVRILCPQLALRYPNPAGGSAFKPRTVCVRIATRRTTPSKLTRWSARPVRGRLRVRIPPKARMRL